VLTDRPNCPTADLDFADPNRVYPDTELYSGLMAKPASDGTWSIDVDFEALYQPRPLAQPRSVRLLVGYRLVDASPPRDLWR
jgi:hypothetical protein